ncbi:MAG: CDP-glucose 4,6-dehydratase [Oscillospiraceae bacterium]|nr:CDP-glucose 4,6-dehydratase [Oscillospiraceae bacterium]
MDLSFFSGKCVLVTGHTGFKGTWLCRILNGAGARVVGFALEPPTQPSLFELCGLRREIECVTGDVRDYGALYTVFHSFKPDIVIHLAAQPIVRESYRNPRHTMETNVMGTVNLLECARESGFVRSLVNVTTDKVYDNREWVWGYRENEKLGGHDPYSGSKACSEIVTDSYRRSYFADGLTAVSTARAGNVIGGGDFAGDRIIPDCVRAAQAGEAIQLRNPNSVRPYQHVLDPLYAYLLIAQRQYEDGSFAGAYNVGPGESGCVTTGRLCDLFCAAWGEDLKWESASAANAPHEAGFLKLDCSKLRDKLGWRPVWDIETAVKKTAEWTKGWLFGRDVSAVMDEQIKEFQGDV